MRTRSMKLKAFSIFLAERSPRRSRSSCRYMPWNFTSWASSSTMLPVTSSVSPSASVPRRYSLASLMRSLRESSLVMPGSYACVGWAKRSVPTITNVGRLADAAGGHGASRLCPPYGGYAMADTSIRVLQIAPSALELNHGLLGDVGAEPLHVRIGTHQRRAHVLGHRLGVAAHIEIGAVVEPFDQVAATVPQTVLHVDLLGRVARERHVHAGERAVLERVLPLELVEEVVRVVAVAEEQPGPAGGAHGAALLHEGAERCDAGAGADHDDVAVGGGQGEMLVGAQLDLHPAALLEALRDVVRRHALAVAAVARVAHRRDQQMHLVADLAARGGDRISAWRQGTGE